MKIATLLLAVAPAVADDWEPAGEQDGIALEWRAAPIGNRAYRGEVSVCTSLENLQEFVGDASRFEKWVPFTEAARAVPNAAGEDLYYVRTSAPWPFKSRDMVYRLTAEPLEGDGAIRIRMQGMPDALPEQHDAVRMQAAEGLWTLTPEDGTIGVRLRLAVDPGRVPGFFVNRRIAATVSGILANLKAKFPCG